jgi:hypothetical protein
MGWSGIFSRRQVPIRSRLSTLRAISITERKSGLTPGFFMHIADVAERENPGVGSHRSPTLTGAPAPRPAEGLAITMWRIRCPGLPLVPNRQSEVDSQTPMRTTIRCLINSRPRGITPSFMRCPSSSTQEIPCSQCSGFSTCISYIDSPWR